MKGGIVWLDGEYIPWEKASVRAMSRTFHYGFGVYEGIRTYEAEAEEEVLIFRLEDHTRRLYESAKILNIAIPFQQAELNKQQCEIIRKNNLRNAYLRPVVFLENEYPGLYSKVNSVRVMIIAWEWDQMYMTHEKYDRGISLKTSSYERVGARNGLNKAKANGMYLTSILANEEAQAAGCDDALMLDSNGFVAEASAANVFIVKNNQLCTPHLTSALDGITRRSIMEMAGDRGVKVVEKQITREDVYTADEMFLTGTASEVLPVVSVDYRVISSGTPGKITRELQKHFFSIVQGKDVNYKKWLTSIKTAQLTTM